MKNLFINKFIIIISLSALCVSCDLGGVIKEQLSLMIDLSKDFGGEWSGSFTSDCYNIEITNSPRLLNNPDSMDYYGVLIGRKIVNSTNSSGSCLKLIVKDEKKSGFITNSTSSEYSYLLSLIKLFKDKSISQYPFYVKSIQAASNVSKGQIEEARKGIHEIDSVGYMEDYVQLINFLIDYKRGKNPDVNNFISKLTNPSDPVLYQLAAESLKMQKEKQYLLKFIMLAAEKDPENVYMLMLNGNYCFEIEAYKETITLYSSVIKQEPENLRAYHTRAWAKFKQGKKTEGCEDINQMYLIKPEVNMPDSTKLICGIK